MPAADIAKRSPAEPHRAILLLVARKVPRPRRANADLAYRAPEELDADLRTVQNSLVQAGAARQAYASSATRVAGRDVRVPSG